MPQDNANKSPIKPVMLFCIGLSAGFIAAVLPRITALLSAQQYTVDVQLFSLDYIIVTVIFSLIIGISMLWIYMGSQKAPRDLFITALSLPAIISGSINMAATTNNGQEQIAQVMEQVKEKDKIVENLTKALESLSNIETISGPSLDLGMQQNSIDRGFFFPNAYAGEGDAKGQATQFNPGVKYIPRAPKKDEKAADYVVVLKSGTDQQVIKDVFQRYQQNPNFSNLVVKESSGRYYLIENKKLPKSLAIINAIKAREKFDDLSPKIIKVK